jgi:hypothetical protein
VEALRKAVDALWKAGSYSWRESRDFRFNDRGAGATPYGFGRTTIGGYTVATVYLRENRRAVFLGLMTAFETPEGWRRFDEMSDVELQWLYGRERPLPPLPRPDMKRQFQHTAVHDVLRLLLQLATNVREENGEIVGELMPGSDGEGFWDYIRNGRELPQFSGIRRNPLTGVVIQLPGPPSRYREFDGRFTVRLDEGAISRLTIAFTATSSARTGANAGSERHQREVFTVDVQEIGTSKVDIAPEVMALFAGTAAGMQPPGR